jgi:hypothetical protein
VAQLCLCIGPDDLRIRHRDQAQAQAHTKGRCGQHKSQVGAKSKSMPSSSKARDVLWKRLRHVSCHSACDMLLRADTVSLHTRVPFSPAG